MTSNSLGAVICEIMGDPFFRKSDEVDSKSRLKRLDIQQKTNEGITPKMPLPPLKDLFQRFKDRKKNK